MGVLGCPSGVVGILGRFGTGFRDFPGNYGSHFGVIFDPFWAHFALQIPPRNSIDFFIDFVLILASFLEVFSNIIGFVFGLYVKMLKPGK